MKRLLLVLCLLGCYGLLSAQTLKRRGAIGVIPVPVPETVAKYLGMDKPTGVLIQSIVPSSTAALIGIQEKDVILSVNSTPIGSPQDLVALSQKLVEGDAVTVNLIRNKEKLTLSGTILPRVSEVAPDLEISLDAFPYEKGLVRSLVKRRKGTAGQKQPVVYFIPGVACMSMGYMPSVDTYRYTTDQLARQGFAVYMVEKPGMGDNQNTTPCSEASFDMELETFRKGYEKLLTYDWVDKNNVFLFGHSMGGIIAPLLAGQFKPQGVVVYGTVLRTWSDYVVDVIRDQRTMLGQDYAEVNEEMQQFREVYHQFFFNKKTPEQLVQQHPKAIEQFAAVLGYDRKGHIFGRHLTYWHELNDKNLYAAWKETDAHVLAIFGEADVAALKPDDHVQIANVVNRYHPGKGEYWFAPRTDHGLVEVGTMKEGLDLMTSPQYGPLVKEKWNKTLIEKIGNWMQEKMAKG